MSSAGAEASPKPPGLLLDVLRADQFSLEHLNLLEKRADEFQHPMKIAEASQVLQKQFQKFGRLVLYRWFDEPSTRTVGSFDSAGDLLNMAMRGNTNASQTSSSVKGESLRDSMRTVNSHLKLYGGGVVVIRHPEVGSADTAAEMIDFPVINAGDGQNEHPTQALLDLYTIKKRLGRTDNLRVVVGGDPKYARTGHSLPIILSKFAGNKITFIGEEYDWLEDSDTRRILEERGVQYQATTELDPLVEADVVYWTRLQIERFKGKFRKRALQKIITKYAQKYSINEEVLKNIPKQAIIMHPLPRGPELPESIDTDPRAAYWDQLDNSVPVRTALLEMILRHYHVSRVAGGVCLNQLVKNDQT